MAVLQYVGARYVPKIYTNPTDPKSAEWTANTAYEPLTVVTYNNSSYISRVPVPATVGNPAENPTEWANTGSYNGFIQQLQTEIDDLQTSVDDQISGFETDINNQFNTFKTQVNANIATKQDVVGGDKQKMVLLIGDSYEDWSSWATNTKTNLAKAGISCDISAKSGSSFWNTANSFAALYAAAPNKGKYTDVLIGGGLNDYQHIAEAQAAMASLAATVHADGARLHFANFGDFWHQPDNRILLWRLYTAEYETAALNGVYIVPHCFGMLHNPAWFNSDGIHPNVTGGAFLGKQMAEYIMTGNNDYLYQVSEGTSKVGYVHNGMLYLSIYTYSLPADMVIESGYTTLEYEEICPFLNPGNLILYQEANFVSTAEPRQRYGLLLHAFGGSFYLYWLATSSNPIAGTLYGLQFAYPTSII